MTSHGGEGERCRPPGSTTLGTCVCTTWVPGEGSGGMGSVWVGVQAPTLRDCRTKGDLGGRPGGRDSSSEDPRVAFQSGRELAPILGTERKGFLGSQGRDRPSPQCTVASLLLNSCAHPVQAGMWAQAGQRRVLGVDMHTSECMHTQGPR